MRKAIVLAILLSCCVCAFAESSSKQSTASAGILISADFGFTIMGDGISTELKITPRRIPQASYPNIPRLPLVGMRHGTGQCLSGSIPFTASVVGNQLVVELSTAPPNGAVWPCYATLLFQAE